MHIATCSRRIFLSFLLFTGLFGALPLDAVAQVVAGKEFVVALPSFWRRIDGGDPETFQVTVMCSRRTNVTVRWSGPTGGLIDDAIVNGGDRLTIQPPSLTVVNFMQEYEDRKPIEVNQRSLYITADQPVTVQVLYDHYNKEHGSRTEQFIVPPISAYDTAYMNLTYSGRGGKNSGMLFIAAEDNTVVTFQPTVTWNFPGILPGGPPETVTLKKHQVFQVLSNERGADALSDLSGTWVKSTKPIGVITFSLQTSAHITPPQPPPPPPQIDTPSTWRYSPAAEFLPPESKGGTLFYTVPYGDQDTSQVRVMALEDETAVTVNGVQGATLARGQFHEFAISGPTKIVTSKPTIAMQVARSGNNPWHDTVLTDRRNDQPDTTITMIYGNPFMAWIPPVTEYKPTLQWTNALINERKVTHDSLVLYAWHHYALITAPVSAINSVQLDGRPVEFQYTHIDGQYATAIVGVLPKQHLLTANAPVSCIAYGFGWDDSYGSTAGEALRSIGIIDVDSITITTCDSIINTTFLLSNIGNNNFRIDSIKAEGVEVKNVIRPSAFPTEMPPGRELDAQLTLRLPRPGTYTGVIRVFTDANNEKVLTLPFRVVRDSAKLNIPRLVDFGPVTADRTSFDTLVTVKNDGENPLTITGLSFDDPRFTVTQPSLPITIPPGGSRSIGVRFTPRPGQVEEGTLRIVGEPCFTPIDVDFSGFQGAGALLGFGRQIVFPPFPCEAPEFVDTTITIRSIGDEPVEITGHAITGTDADLFTLLNSIVGTIAPGDSAVLRIRYTPSRPGPHSAQIDLSSSAKNVPATVPITMSGAWNTSTAEPNMRTLDFGQHLACDDPLPRPIVLRNSGTVDAEITAFEGLEGGPFSIETSLPLGIPPVGTEREITVRFNPTADGQFVDTLFVVGGPCDIRERVILRGSRVTPSLAVDKPALGFGTLFFCEGARIATFTITNDGPVHDTLERVTQAGSAAFSLEALTYPLVLAPGESRTVTVTVAPDAEGSFAGSFEFNWGPCAGTIRVDVDAVVVDPKVTLSADAVDFGQVSVTGPAGRRTITITNGSSVERTIGAITLNDSDVKLIRPATLPVTLGPGESIEIELEYGPGVAGTLTTTADVEIIGPCPQSETITITGEAIGDVITRASFTIEMPENLSGQVDAAAPIPILIRNGTNMQAAAPTEITVALSWHYTVLLPVEVATALPGVQARIENDRIVGDRRQLEVIFTGTDFPSDGELGRLNALVLLGDRGTTDITVTAVGVVSPPNRDFTITTDDGSFTTTGICPIDGDRFILLGGSLKLSAPRPNPTSGTAEIDLDVPADGEATLVIYDMLGVEQRTAYAGHLRAGSYTVPLRVQDLSPGLYVCELRSGGERVQQTILVTR